jgi:hypothetical protein
VSNQLCMECSVKREIAQCPDCGEAVALTSIYCVKCYRNHSTQWPSDDVLLKANDTPGGIAQLARKLRVTFPVVANKVRRIQNPPTCSKCGTSSTEQYFLRKGLCEGCRPQCACGKRLPENGVCSKCRKTNEEESINDILTTCSSERQIHRGQSVASWPDNETLLRIGSIRGGQSALAKKLGVSRERVRQKVKAAKELQEAV